MRKVLGSIAVAVATVPLLVAQPASAHATWGIVGYQFGWADGASVGLGGYVNDPACFFGAANPACTLVEFGNGRTDDGFGSITNYDPVPHTFTHCTSACDTTVGVSDPLLRLFHYDLPPGATASDMSQLDALQDGTYTVMCLVHTWMRAEFTLVR